MEVPEEMEQTDYGFYGYFKSDWQKTADCLYRTIYSGVGCVFKRIVGKELSGSCISGDEQIFDRLYRRRIERVYQ